MIKLIATDMDGTLLNNKHEIPKDFKKTIESLQKANIQFAISTGRNYLDILNKLKEYENELIFICENGSAIYYKGECIYSKFLENSDIEKLVKIGRKIENAYPMLCGTKGLYAEENKVLGLLDKHFPMDLPINIVDSLLEVDDDVFKVNMFDLNDAQINSYPIFKNEKLENISLTPSGLYWLDMMQEGVNKGIAIKKVQEKFGITFDETMIFGDHLNDLEMMESGYYSYAMKNGHDEVKKIANFVTKYTNEESGVIKTIDEVTLKNKEL